MKKLRHVSLIASGTCLAQIFVCGLLETPAPSGFLWTAGCLFFLTLYTIIAVNE